jgi:hypothetical protein
MLNWWSMRLLLYLWPWMCNLISRWRYIHAVTHPRPQVQQQTHGPPIEHYIPPPTYQVTHPRPQVQQQMHEPPIEHNNLISRWRYIMLNWWSMRLLLYLWPWMCNLISRWRYIMLNWWPMRLLLPICHTTVTTPYIQQQHVQANHHMYGLNYINRQPPYGHFIPPPQPRLQVPQQTHVYTVF